MLTPPPRRSPPSPASAQDQCQCAKLSYAYTRCIYLFFSRCCLCGSPNFDSPGQIEPLLQVQTCDPAPASSHINSCTTHLRRINRRMHTLTFHPRNFHKSRPVLHRESRRLGKQLLQRSNPVYQVRINKSMNSRYSFLFETDVNSAETQSRADC